MKKYFYIILILFFTKSISFAMTNEELYRLKYKAKTEIAKNEIQKYCSKEDPGLEIDSAIANQINFTNSCKCAIKAGKESDVSLAKDILELCNL